MTRVNDYLSDALTRRQVYIERLKTAQSMTYNPVRAAIIAALRSEFNTLDIDDLSELSRTEFKQIIKRVTAKHDQAYAEYVAALVLWLASFSQAESAFTLAALKRTIRAPEVTAPNPDTLWGQVRGAVITATGATILTEMAAFRKTTDDLISRSMQTHYANKSKVTDLVRSIIGTRAQKYRNGMLNGLQNKATAKIHTVIQHVSSYSKHAVFKRFKKYTKQYIWISILDSRTSDVCRALSGRTFDYDNGPLPPAHPRCRSHIEIIWNEGVEFLRGKLVNTEQQTYYAWLKRQPAAFIDDVIGPSRGKLLRNGGITAKRFAELSLNKAFEPLTLDEMAAKAPLVFQTANVNR